MQKGQVSLEYLMVAGFLLVIIGLAFFYSQSSLSQSMADSKTRVATDKIALAINEAYALGPGTQLEIEIDLPYGIQSEISEDTLIGYVVSINGNNASFYKDTKAALSGSLPITEGVHVITITTNNLGIVAIGAANQLLLTPTSLTLSVDEGTIYSEKYLFTINNSADTSATGLALSVDGTIAPFVSLPSITTPMLAGATQDFNITIALGGAEASGSYTGYLTITSDDRTDSSLLQLTINADTPPSVDTTPPAVLLSSPANGSTPSVALVDFNFIVSDANTISSCDLLVGGSVVGTTGSPAKDVTVTISYTLPNSSLATWDVNCIDVAGNSAIASNGTFTIQYVPTPTVSKNYLFQKRVATGNDDAEQRVSNGSMTLTGSDLEIVDADGSTEQQVGVRFIDVNIPTDATINSAYIEFEIDKRRTETTNLVIYGEKHANPTTFLSTANDITDRTKTTTSVAWSSVTAPNKNDKLQTVDISSIVDEVIGEVGWAANNSMIFIFTGSGRREVESYNGESSAAALLVVDYNYI